MLFNSVVFFLFFSIVFISYWSFPPKYRKFIIILGGIVFYGYSSLPYLLHFLLVIAVNFFLYKIVRKYQSKKILTLTIILNILNLGFFKYFYFFCKFLFSLTSISFFQEIPNSIKIIFPLAISFYTFQMIALQVDSYRGRIYKNLNFSEFLLFFLFFPVLIAGPILRTEDFFPNFERTEPRKSDIYDGTYLLISGIIKKVILADSLGSTVNPAFNSPLEYGSLDIVLLGYTYLIQLYFDFSGLTDMARGVSLYLGIEIPDNFRAPFFSRSLGEFWSRWHITLSSWLRDYLYFSMGGSRVSKPRVYSNLIATMTIGGFWHGPDYTFISWGLYWGIFLAAERFIAESYGIDPTPKSRWGSVLGAFWVTTVAAFSVLMFRANDTQGMFDIFNALFSNFKPHDLIQYKHLSNMDSVLLMGVVFIFAHIVQFKPSILERFRKYDTFILISLGVITIFLLTCVSQDGNDFIYYKF